MYFYEKKKNFFYKVIDFLLFLFYIVKNFEIIEDYDFEIYKYPPKSLSTIKFVTDIIGKKVAHILIKKIESKDFSKVK